MIPPLIRQTADSAIAAFRPLRTTLLALLLFAGAGGLWATNDNPCEPDGDPPEDIVCPYWDTDTCEWVDIAIPQPEGEEPPEGMYWDPCVGEWVPHSPGDYDSHRSLTFPAPLELLGSRSRKISIDGRPIPDEKPENDDESDYVPEETYVDALNQSFHYSTTDVFIPVPGSDLSVSVRRNTTSEVFTGEPIFEPDDRPDMPFGPGWTSNVGAVATFECNTSISSNTYRYDRYANIQDENGVSHRFIIGGNGYGDWKPEEDPDTQQYTGNSRMPFVINEDTVFVPLPSGDHDAQSYRNTLEVVSFAGGIRLRLTKKHGTVLTYQMVPKEEAEAPFVFEDYVYEKISGIMDYKTGSPSSTNRNRVAYARLLSVSDRLGNTVNYEYNLGNKSLIPDSISWHEDPGLGVGFQDITVVHDGKRVLSVEDPRGNLTTYTYSERAAGEEGFPWAVRMLEAVDRAGISTTSFDYQTITESLELVYADRPIPAGDGLDCWKSRYYEVPYAETNPGEYYHWNLHSITDANANVFRIEYAFDHSKLTRSLSESGGECDFDGYKVAYGQPRIVKSIDFRPPWDGAGDPPAFQDLSSFSRNAMIKISAKEDPYYDSTIGQRVIVPSYSGHHSMVCTDAEGGTTTYHFLAGRLYALNDFALERNDPDAYVMDRLGIFYRGMSISHAGGTETVYYDIEAGLSPVEEVDVSGNSTRYEYNDPLEEDFERVVFRSNVVTDAPTIQPKYSDPTAKIDALGNRTEYEYKTSHSWFGDPTGFRILEKEIDRMGRETRYQIDTDGRRTKASFYNGTGGFGGSPFEETTWSYDFNFKGVVTSESTSRKQGGDGLVLTTSYQLFGNGSPAPGKISSMTVGADTTHYTYDANGNRTSVTDPRGNRTDFEYDDLNRLTKITYPPDSSGSRPFREFVYDPRGNKILEIDENGVHTLFQYDGRNRKIRQIRDMDGDHQESAADLVTVFEYNDVGSLTKTISPAGSVVINEYDGIQRLTQTSVLEAEDGGDGIYLETAYFYETDKNCGGSIFRPGSFQPTRIEDPRGYQTRTEYDALLRPVSAAAQFRNPGSAYAAADYAITDYTEYDAAGNLLESIDPLGMVSRMSYNARNEVITVTEAYGTSDQSTTKNFYTTGGRVWKTMDPLNRETVTEYDVNGRPSFVIAPQVPDAADAMTPASPVTENQYDGNGNLTAMINPRQYQWEYEYDSRNRQTREEAPPAPYVDENGQWVASPVNGGVVTTEYDAIGNPVRVTNQRNLSTTTIYDRANRPIYVVFPATTLRNPANPATTLTVHPVDETVYDDDGRVLRTIKGYSTVQTTSRSALESAYTPVRTTVINTYDKAGRLLTTTTPMASGGDIVVVNGYDASGNRIRVTDGEGRVSTFAYDGLGRNTATAYGGEIGAAGADTTYQDYNAINLVLRTDPSGRVTRYRYDDLHRLSTVDYGDDGSIDRRYQYDRVGNILSVDEGADPADFIADVAYTYDALNRIETETSVGLAHRYAYDLAGNRLETIYAEGAADERSLSATYDALNRTEEIDEDGRVSEYRYDLAGNIRRKLQPNGDIITRQFDPLGRMFAVTGPDAGTGALYQQDYLYDLYGNLAAVTETYPGGSLENRVVINLYDQANRLHSEEMDFATSPDVVTTYGYDRSNNRVSKTVHEGGALVEDTTYVFTNPFNQIENSSDSVSGRQTTYAYDDNGARTLEAVDSDGDGTDDVWTTYTYDFENRLTDLAVDQGVDGTIEEEYAYRYDYRTRRVLRDESQAGGVITALVFSGGLSVREYTVGADYSESAELVPGDDPDVLPAAQTGVDLFGDWTRQAPAPYFETDSNTNAAVGKAVRFSKTLPVGSYEVQVRIPPSPFPGYPVNAGTSKGAAFGQGDPLFFDVDWGDALTFYPGEWHPVGATVFSDGTEPVAVLLSTGTIHWEGARTQVYVPEFADAVRFVSAQTGDWVEVNATAATFLDILEHDPLVGEDGETLSLEVLPPLVPGVEYEVFGQWGIHPDGHLSSEPNEDTYHRSNANSSGTVGLAARFSADLPPGNYRVEAWSPYPLDGAPATVMTAVRAGGSIIGSSSNQDPGGQWVDLGLNFSLSSSSIAETVFSTGAVAPGTGETYLPFYADAVRFVELGGAVTVVDDADARLHPALPSDPILAFGAEPPPPHPSVPILGEEGTLEVEYIRGSDYGGGIGGILYSLRSGAPSFKHYNSRGDVVAATDATGSLTYQAAYEAFGKHGDTPSSQEYIAPGAVLDRQRANTKDEDPTGLLNEGFRYRDLETGVFITRDPLGFVDGPNVYTYVVQNPWTFFDPLGLLFEEDAFVEYQQNIAEADAMGVDRVQHYRDQAEVFLPGVGGNPGSYGAEKSRQKIEESKQTIGQVAIWAAIVIFLEKMASDNSGGEDPSAPSGKDISDQNTGATEDPNGGTTTEWRERKEKGADGATGNFGTETDSDGDTVSTTHSVTDEDGNVIHQHQDHVGKHGGKRRFPDEWTGTETTGDPPVDDHPPTKYQPPEDHETADP